MRGAGVKAAGGDEIRDATGLREKGRTDRLAEGASRRLVRSLDPGPPVLPCSSTRSSPSSSPCSPSTSPAQTRPAPPLPTGIEEVARVEGIAEYRLENGLQLLLVPDDSKPTTTVNVTYRVGSRHESYGETGMAHLLEHMLFKGTPTTATSGQEFDQAGRCAPTARPGTTAPTTTRHFAPSDDNLRWVSRLEADRMIN